METFEHVAVTLLLVCFWSGVPVGSVRCSNESETRRLYGRRKITVQAAHPQRCFASNWAQPVGSRSSLSSFLHGRGRI